MYVTPELAVNAVQRLQQLHQRCGLSLVAVDEAHCVSECAWPPACLSVLLHEAITGELLPCSACLAAAKVPFPGVAGCRVPS